MMTPVEIISIVKDVVVALAAVITATIAIMGLERWKAELKGKANFETARKLMHAVYKLRDQIMYFRSPFYSASEFPDDYEPLAQRTPESEVKAFTHIFNNRWKPLVNALPNFESSALEAEAIWGNTIKTKTDEFRLCLHHLQIGVDAVIHDKASGGQDFKDREFGKEMNARVSATRDSTDPLSLKIKSAIEAIESEVRVHIDRS